MAFKLIHATEARAGAAVVIDDVPCIVKSNDISRPGKHGHAKCRIEAIGIVDGKKKVIAMSGHDRLDVPLINKNKAQVLSILDDRASIMDLESYETIDISVPEELKEELKEGDQIEYWNAEGNKIIKKKL